LVFSHFLKVLGLIRKRQRAEGRGQKERRRKKGRSLTILSGLSTLLTLPSPRPRVSHSPTLLLYLFYISQSVLKKLISSLPLGILKL